MTDYSAFQFTIKSHTSQNRARFGNLKTPHGSIETPAFIFCATKGAMKAVAPQEMKAHGTQIILSNTYHLMVQPTSERILQQGGLHRFMAWDGPLLTDSGGFQIFSLGHGSVTNEIKGKKNTSYPKTLLKITEEGAFFRSYLNGSKECLTPERSIQIQKDLGADLILVFDECTPFHVEKEYTQHSMQRSHRWALRSLKAFQTKNHVHDGRQALYGIVQGGIYPDLRIESCTFNNENNFFGYAIGGSLGQTPAQMEEVVAFTTEKLNRERPIHLLGIGRIKDIFSGVQYGIDTFDCVHPSRLARHGGALIPYILWDAENPSPLNRTTTHSDHLNLWNTRFKNDTRCIESGCPCTTCENFSRAYIHHLLKSKELLVYSLLTIHNVSFMNRLLTAIRNAIQTDTLETAQRYWAGK